MVGRNITVKGLISIPSGRQNPLGFNYKSYLAARNIYAICDTNKYKIKAEEAVRPLRNYLSNQKYQFYEVLENNLENDSFALIIGTMFGDTSYMDENDYSSFKKSGISHILAVSGLHVNLAYTAIYVLLGKKRNIKTDFIAIILIFFYAALSNFSVSVIRASLMIVCKIVSFHLNRRYDSVSCISAIASVILLINPNMVFDSGLQLSFAASYTMGIVYPWSRVKLAKLSDKIKKEWAYKICNIFLPGLVASVGTGPLVCYHFLCFSPISFLLNPLVVYLAGIQLPLCLGIFSAFILLPEGIYSWIIYVFSDIVQLLAKVIIYVSKLGSSIYPDTDVCAPPLSGLILYYLLFFLFFSEFRHTMHRKKKYTKVVLTYLLTFILGLGIPKILNITSTIVPWSYGLSDAIFLDVGQGDSIYLNLGNYHVLVDGGGKYSSNIAESVLKPFLLKNGIKELDLAIITHMDMDHCKGIQQLAEIYTINQIISNHDIYENIEDENESCLVLSVNIDGLNFLLMADAGTKQEDNLISRYPSLCCDILKVAHHGSANSTSYAFVKHVSPSFAAISVGAKNTYGHPAQRVIELLNNSAIIYGRTDEYGALCLKKVCSDYYIIENAAKDKQWLIKRDRKNTLQEQ